MDTLRLDHLIRFYSILHDLEDAIGGARTLAGCSGRMQWPGRGVYFFREPGEHRSNMGEGPRVIRVGTHALKTDPGRRFGPVSRNIRASPARAARLHNPGSCAAFGQPPRAD